MLGRFFPLKNTNQLKTINSARCFGSIKKTSKKAKFLIGTRLPNTDLYTSSPKDVIKPADLFSKRKSVLFSVPGAFVPGCSHGHIPEYLENVERFKTEGYTVIACLSVNDPYVMTAWGKSVDPDRKLLMLSDPKAEFTKAIGMELDCTSLLGDIRSKRYSLLIDDGVVTHVSQEPDDSGLSCLLCIQKMKRIQQSTIDR
ncbi:DgyrCDS9166 [Dimorphilus gyrociliatus]|uniref:Peroxiredoxin-5 n=1 Tax=Dimorphilus gyrociliatus TaxID=2664684 RepID=A0A7I8VXJ3_9ANNE|nr:DgyrCDS9166 [Dimorphilus gyrociliatus]